MNTELKLQALVDGELEARDTREVEALLASDAANAATEAVFTITPRAPAPSGASRAMASAASPGVKWSRPRSTSSSAI